MFFMLNSLDSGTNSKGYKNHQNGSFDNIS